MRRELVLRRGWIALTAALVLVGVPAEAGVTTVNLGNNFFSPGRVALGSPGGQVRWDWPANSFPHNVREDSRLFRSGAPTTDASASFLRTFSSGTFHYYCEIHGSAAGGMAGLVRVRPSTAAAPTGLPFTVRWATSATNTGSAFDVQFRVGGGNWQNWRSDTQAVSRVFGMNGSPVTVTDGTTYGFRARSQRRTDTPDAVSRWSPAASFTA